MVVGRSVVVGRLVVVAIEVVVVGCEVVVVGSGSVVLPTVVLLPVVIVDESVARAKELVGDRGVAGSFGAPMPSEGLSDSGSFLGCSLNGREPTEDR